MRLVRFTTQLIQDLLIALWYAAFVGTGFALVFAAVYFYLTRA